MLHEEREAWRRRNVPAEDLLLEQNLGNRLNLLPLLRQELSAPSVCIADHLADLVVNELGGLLRERLLERLLLLAV